MFANKQPNAASVSQRFTRRAQKKSLFAESIEANTWHRPSLCRKNRFIASSPHRKRSGKGGVASTRGRGLPGVIPPSPIKGWRIEAHRSPRRRYSARASAVSQDVSTSWLLQRGQSSVTSGQPAPHVLSRSRTDRPRPLAFVPRLSLLSINNAAVASWSRSLWGFKAGLVSVDPEADMLPWE